MEVSKTIQLKNSRNEPIGCDVIFFTVEYNHFRDVSQSSAHEMRDSEDMRQCECVLCLPSSYSDDGDATPLIISFHGAGSRVCADDGMVGGINYVSDCIEAGYAALDVCGSEPHGLTMGCPEHIFAAYKAYRYAVKNYNVSERVLVAGASMGGHVAMNFANMFPGIVVSIGMIDPRLNIDAVTVDGHTCIGTWDKTVSKNGKPSTHDRIVEIYRFPRDEWYEPNTVGFNPYKTRSFINSDGERVVIPPCPIKIWQGTADTTVDPVMVCEFVSSVRRSGSYIELHLLDGVAHKISPVMKSEMLIWFNRFV